MDVGWGAGGCRAKVMTLSISKSARYILGERKVQSSSTLLEQRRSAPAAQCSTSGTCHPTRRVAIWRSTFYHRQRWRGKCNYASEGSTEMREIVQEVMEWHPRRSPQRQDVNDDSGREDEGQNLALASADYGTALELRGDRSDGSTRAENRVDEEEVEGQNEAGKNGGWRGLTTPEDVTQRGRSFRLGTRWRKTKDGRQQFKSAGYLTSPSPREGKKVLGMSRDTNLDDLFKSLASPQRSDRSSAVERYFGRDRNEKVMASKTVDVAGDRITAGDSSVSLISVRGNEIGRRASEPTGPRLPGEGERLKINLELDLYRAKCLMDEGRRSEAEVILMQCIRDWQDDGRAYLALGLVAMPLSGEKINGIDRESDSELERSAGVVNKRSFARDSLTFGDVVEGEGMGTSRATVPRIPGVSEGGERLKINLDLQLYQAKCLKQRGRLDVSESTLRKCIRDWPDDGRPYVALGKQLSQQNRVQEARALYDSGCQAVRGENPFIWQTWAVLEEKAGDVSKARKLFDAATVADKKHVAGWHGWAKLELRAGNVKKARSLLSKGLKFCGSNEYIFQTLALLEVREGKVEQARLLLSKATQYNPNSAASWLAWALMEAENNLVETARRLFQSMIEHHDLVCGLCGGPKETWVHYLVRCMVFDAEQQELLIQKGIEASPKNRYVWQAWALFEAKQGKEERARELFQTGRDLNPRDVVLLQAFALFEFKCGRPGVARDLFRRALTCDSSHQPVWIAWGWMEWKQRNLSVARELYQGAIQADARTMDAARAFQAWGVLEDREGDCGLARELFKCALKVDSQNVPAWMSWAAMEDREGRSVRADEIRNLFLQQRTEVVEGPWDVDFSDLLAPAIDRIKGFFKVDQPPGPSGTVSIDETDLDFFVGDKPSLDTGVYDQDFDVETFLKEKFPWKYGYLDRRMSSELKLAQKPTRKSSFSQRNHFRDLKGPLYS